MPTVTVTRSFLSNLESMVEEGHDSDYAAAWLSSDGSPASGCLQFTSPTGEGGSGHYEAVLGGASWDSLFGLSGATVTQTRITGWKVRFVGISAAISTLSVQLGIVSNSGVTSITSGAWLVNQGFTAAYPTGWQAEGAGGLQNVDSGSQPSSTSVRLYIRLTTNTVGFHSVGSLALDVRLDEITWEVTYSTGTPISASDSGTGADSASIIAAAVAGAETGSGADAGAAGHEASAGETGSGSDAASVAASIGAGEAAGGTEGGLPAGPGAGVAISASETAAAVESVTVSIQGTADTWILFSDDDGRTWSVPVATIPNGTHPTITRAEDGTLIVAAYVAGNIQARVRRAGDIDFGALFTFIDDTLAVMSVENDTFHLVQVREGPNRWILAVRILAEAAVSEWVSGDTAASWKRVV